MWLCIKTYPFISGEVGAEIMEELLVVCDDHKSSNDFRTRKWYAVEFAAKSSTAEVLEVLVDSYLYSPPQHNLKSRPRVNLRDSKGDMEHFGLNLIDLALLEIDEDNADVTIQKIVLLHEYDGKVLLRRNSDGEIPLHYMIRKFKMKHLNEELGNSYFKVIQAMCMLSPNIVKYKMEGRVKTRLYNVHGVRCIKCRTSSSSSISCILLDMCSNQSLNKLTIKIHFIFNRYGAIACAPQK